LVTHNLQLSCACFLDNKLLLTRQWLNMLTIPGLLVFLFLDFLFPISHLSFLLSCFVYVCLYGCMFLRVCSLVFYLWDFSS
jgi:hypothetical protein